MLRNIYKYLKIFQESDSNLIRIVRYLFSTLAILFVVIKLKEEVSWYNLEFIFTNVKMHFNGILLFGVLILFMLNHILDGFNWKYILRPRKEISLFQAIQMNWTSLAFSFYSPNRLLDVPAKVLMLSEMEGRFKWSAGGIYNVLKPASTFVLTLLVIGLLPNPILFWWMVPLFLLLGLLGLKFYRRIAPLNWMIKRFRQWNILWYYWSKRNYLLFLILNIIRILSFTLQHYCILRLLGFHFPATELMVYLILIHTVITFLPQIGGTEVFMKTFLSIYLLDLQPGDEVMLTMAVLILWCMNVLVPTCFGLLLQKSANLKIAE